LFKVYFNTKTFDDLIKNSEINITVDPGAASLLVLGAQKVDYNKFTKLKAVYRFGVGSDNIDFEFLKKRGVPVHFPSRNVLEILYDSTANFTVYGILNCLYRDALGDAETWKKAKRDYAGNKTALVIGSGNIGKKVASKLAVFMKVGTYDILYNKDTELMPLIKEADIVTAHLPLNDNTKCFFDAEKISWIKNGALIVNTARGPLFDENALYDKLKSTDCRAFFDVFWEEPYRGRLKDLGRDKFFMTPHSASNTKDFIAQGFKDILDILKGLNAHE
jgi:phosphoglycerate dehydrogenase-like enzyme